MDPLLFFDCLMYLNNYYYYMFTMSNIAIWIAKNLSDNDDYNTPNIVRDAYIAASLTISELLKIILFRKFRHRYTGWSVVLAVFLTIVSMLALLYVFLIQWPVLRLEFCLDIMLFVLLAFEVVCGVNVFLPCCNQEEY
ncbi:hypothetical protein PPYR_02694 [Photinus pyralis]|uniref:Ion transport domain-containing protein n=1 Tax=Photinus pyralis TaxID=7054 RepID=A0A1Y1MRH6_PHOPY|nr:uncharacterized protein LOC116161699 [Photinus pyralis]KAB0790894.1 hypothetical protein PPYR_02694 [Photinus pyralis]